MIDKCYRDEKTAPPKYWGSEDMEEACRQVVGNLQNGPLSNHQIFVPMQSLLVVLLHNLEPFKLILETIFKQIPVSLMFLAIKKKI